MLDRHINATSIFLPAIYVVWMIGGTYIAIYGGMLFLAGSLSLAIHQSILERFWTDLKPKDLPLTVLGLFKKSHVGPPANSVRLEDLDPEEEHGGARSREGRRRLELSTASRELYEKISRFVGFRPLARLLTRSFRVQSIKSTPARTAISERLSHFDSEVLWVYERHNMLQHPWTRTFRGMLFLTIGMVLTAFSLSFVLLTYLPSYGPVGVAATIAVLTLIGVASPAVFLTREVIVLTTEGVYLASKRPFGLAVRIGYIARENALKCYISMRGFEANCA